jgi:predicted amidohydrolase YtcJ
VRNGRFAAVGDNLPAPGRGIRRIDLKGKTVIPGLIDAHNHIVLVGNRPGWHTPLEHVFTIPDAIAALRKRAAGVPPGEFITTIGPIAAMQFPEKRLPTLTELDAVDRPVYIQAAQGGARTNTLGKTRLEASGNAPPTARSQDRRSTSRSRRCAAELLTPRRGSAGPTTRCSIRWARHHDAPRLRRFSRRGPQRRCRE